MCSTRIEFALSVPGLGSLYLQGIAAETLLAPNQAIKPSVGMPERKGEEERQTRLVGLIIACPGFCKYASLCTFATPRRKAAVF